MSDEGLYDECSSEGKKIFPLREFRVPEDDFADIREFALAGELTFDDTWRRLNDFMATASAFCLEGCDEPLYSDEEMRDFRDLCSDLMRTAFSSEVASAAKLHEAVERSGGHPFPNGLRTEGNAAVRLSTGLPTFDERLRGGLTPGVYTFVGPPGRGKTSLLDYLAHRFAETHRAFVAAIFADANNWQSEVVIGQLYGFDREYLENQPDKIRKELVTAVTNPVLILPEYTELDTLLDFPVPVKGPARVLCLDSVQKVRLRKDSEGKGLSAKEHAEEFMRIARLLAADGWIVLVASRANRASYAKKKDTDNTEPITAGLDSASIEYDSDVFAFAKLESSKAEAEAGTVRITLEIGKNRISGRLFETSLVLFEANRPVFREEIVAETPKLSKTIGKDGLTVIQRAVLKVLKAGPESGMSQRAVERGAGRNASAVRTALRELKDAGKALLEDGLWKAVR